MIDEKDLRKALFCCTSREIAQLVKGPGGPGGPSGDLDSRR